MPRLGGVFDVASSLVATHGSGVSLVAFDEASMAVGLRHQVALMG
jgi:hypothetical protein